MPSHQAIRVVFVAFEGMALLDLCGPLSTLGMASLGPRRAGKPPVYETHVVSTAGGLVTPFEGLPIATTPLSSLDGLETDTLIVPGGPDRNGVTADAGLIAWVKARAPKCRRVCSVCTGAFLLASAGLLEGRRAVTHWSTCAILARQHPDVAVEADAIFVKDGNIWTSAGITTGIDLALALIEEDFGRELAMYVARLLVVYLRRTGGQSQYSTLLAAQTRSDADKFAQLERWIAENLTEDLRVERLAKRSV